jgi:hypothetical protein
VSLVVVSVDVCRHELGVWVGVVEAVRVGVPPGRLVQFGRWRERHRCAIRYRLPRSTYSAWFGLLGRSEPMDQYQGGVVGKFVMVMLGDRVQSPARRLRGC